MPNIEALEQLKRVVRDAPDNLWDMTTLGALPNCGSVGCALHHTYGDRWFRANTNIENCFCVNNGQISSVWVIQTAEIFGLGFEESAILFGLTTVFGNYKPDGPIPKSAVIANIDALIRGEPPMPYVASLAGATP